jgi:hypothetical protein
MDRAISPSLADEGAKLICYDLRRQIPQVTNQTLAPQLWMPMIFGLVAWTYLVYKELLEPSSINRVLILDCPFNKSAGLLFDPSYPKIAQVPTR